jgi:hypothetical protein
VKVPIHVGERITTERFPRTHEEIEDMACLPYVSAIFSIRYVIFCLRPDIAHAVGVLRR